MNKKIILIILIIVFGFICLHIYLKSIENQKITHELMERLNSNSQNYIGLYEEEYEHYGWWGSPAHSDLTSRSNISIEVMNGEVINYILKYIQESSYASEKQNYSEYYDRSKRKLCAKGLIKQTQCDKKLDSRELNWIPSPNKEGFIPACKAEFSEDFSGGYYECVCTKEKTIINSWNKLYCPRKVFLNDLGMLEIHATYSNSWTWPENPSICFYTGIDRKSGQLYAFECNNQNITLTPVLNISFPLPLVSYYCTQNGDLCKCDLEPIETGEICYDKIPEDTDMKIKGEIISFITETNQTSFTKEDNAEYGTCFYAMRENLKQTFCFNQENLVTFAMWGSNISTSELVKIDIRTFRKIQTV